MSYADQVKKALEQRKTTSTNQAQYDQMRASWRQEGDTRSYGQAVSDSVANALQTREKAAKNRDSVYESSFMNKIKGLGQDRPEVNFGNVGDIFGKRSQQSQDLAFDIQGMREYLEANRDGFTRKERQTWDRYLNNAAYLDEQDMKWYTAQRDYYSQWGSQEEYEDFLAQQEEAMARQAEREQWLAYDVEAAQQRLKELEANAGYETYYAPQMIAGQAVPIQQLRMNGKDRAAMTALQQEINQAKRIQEQEKLASVTGNEDFDKYSAYRDEQGAQELIQKREDSLFTWMMQHAGEQLNPETSDAYYDYVNREQNFITSLEKALEDRNDANEVYHYINATQEERDKLDSQYRGYGRGNAKAGAGSEYYRKGYHLLDDKQKSVFNYYYNTEGADKAREYLDSIQEELNSRIALGLYAPLEGRTAAQIGYMANAGLDQFKQGVIGLGEMLSGEKDYIAASPVQITSGMVREDLGDAGPKLPEWLGGGSLAQGVYDTGTSVFNMAPSILVSMASEAVLPGSGALVGNALMGASAAGNAYSQMLNMGYNKDQATGYGALVGASEALLGELIGGVTHLGGVIPGEGLEFLLKNVDNALGRASIELGGKMFSEFTEEYLQTVLEPWYQSVALGVENEGLDFLDPEALYSGLLGALTAGLMDSPGIALGSVQQYRTGKKAQEAGVDPERLRQLGMTFQQGSETRSIAERMQAKPEEQAATEEPARARSTEEILNETANTGQEQQEAWKAPSTSAIGRLIRSMGNELPEATVTDIALKLQSKGWSRDVAWSNAELVERAMTGGISRELGDLMDRNTVLRETVEEVLGEGSSPRMRVEEYRQIMRTLNGEQETDGTGDVVGAENATADEYFAGAINPEEITQEAMNAAIQDYTFTPETKRGMEAEFNALDDRGKLDYVRGLKSAAEYGRLGIPLETVAATEYGSRLPEATRNQVWVNARQTELKRTKAQRQNARQGDGKVHFERNGRTFDSVRETAITAMEQLSRLRGNEFYIFESYEKDGTRYFRDKNGNEKVAPNGWYDPEDGSIHIDLNAGGDGRGTMLFTLAHELTHDIKQSSPEQYETLKTVLLEAFVKDGQDLLEMIDSKKAREEGLTDEGALEEVVADAMESMLTDGTVLEALAEIKKKDKGLWQKIVDFFKDFAEDLKKMAEAYRDRSAETNEGRLVQQMDGLRKELQDIYTKALAEDAVVSDGQMAAQARDEKTAPEGGVKYSMRDLDIERIYIDFSDSKAELDAITETADSLLNRGKTVKISRAELDAFQGINANSDWKKARFTIKTILKAFAGETVQFRYKDSVAEAYLTKEGVNHTASGANSPGKAAALTKYYELVKKAEYCFSSKNDPHSKSNQKIPGKIDWDSFVAVADVDGEQMPIVFKIRTIDGDLRSQIYKMATKEEVSYTHDHELKENLQSNLPDYRISPTSKTRITDPDTVVKPKNQLREGKSNRELLAGALETVAQTDMERERLEEYRGKIADIDELERELTTANKEIRSMIKGDIPYSRERMLELRTQANAAANRIDIADRQLLRLEATAPMKAVLERQRKAEQKKTTKRVEAYRAKVKESREITEAKGRIRKIARAIRRVADHGNKERNVKEGLRPLVENALSTVDLLFQDSVSRQDMVRSGIGTELTERERTALEAAQSLQKQLDGMTQGTEQYKTLEGKLQYQMGKLTDAFERERLRLSKTEVNEAVGKLAEEYRKLSRSEDPYIREVYDQSSYELLAELQETLKGVKIRDASLEQLKEVKNAYAIVLASIRNSNKLFNEQARAGRVETARAVESQIAKNSKTTEWTQSRIMANNALWNNLKPVYAKLKVKSEAFQELVQGLFDGQYKWAQNVEAARKYREGLDGKYGTEKWDRKKKFEFTDSLGKRFRLNLEQMLSLYAYSRRDQAHDHLLKGGFVFGRDGNVQSQDATAYKLGPEQLGEIFSKLTESQKRWAEEMQRYLSRDMAELGNEVSMKLYGIRLFEEQNYFPLRSAGQYQARAREADLKKNQGMINIVNSSFTKKTQPGAGNPIVLDGFGDIWSSHVNEMGMYNAMVLPMEDFRRVYNYASRNLEDGESTSVEAALQNAYGKAATQYFNELYKQLNGGVVIDPTENLSKQMTARFKKGAVMASLSVAVQQPSAVARAWSMIDPKYFAGGITGSWEQLKKWAGVAIIKDMGGFDTHSGYGAQQYLMGADNTLIGKVDKAAGWLPEKADQVTWLWIWSAVQREVRQKNPGLSGDAFYRKCGRRFSEIIEQTQVYDSTLSRSANMRSKSLFMQMATSFMAEPTTTANMVQSALESGSIGKIAGTLGAVAASILINNALASLVYAARDDDEDETFLEKYAQSFASGLVDDLNPMGYFPILRDVWSIFQGYDVDRADMTIVTDITKAMQRVSRVLKTDTSEMDEGELREHEKDVWDALLGVLDSGATAFGVPMKNLRREVSALVNVAETARRGDKTTALSLADAIAAGVSDAVPGMESKSKRRRLFDALAEGDREYAQRLQGTYQTEQGYHSAVRKALREYEPRILEAATALHQGDYAKYELLVDQMTGEGRFDRDDILDAIDKERDAMEPEEAREPTSKTKGLYGIEDLRNAMEARNTEGADSIFRDLVETKMANGDSLLDASNAVESSARSEVRELYFGRLLDARAAESYLQDYAGATEEEAKEYIREWQIYLDYGKFDRNASSTVHGLWLEGAMTDAVAMKALTKYAGMEADKAADRLYDWEVTKKYGTSWEERAQAYKTGSITRAQLKEILIGGGYDSEEAELQIQTYDWQKKGLEDATPARVKLYNEYCKALGVPEKYFLECKVFDDQTENDKDKDGNPISYSAVKKIMEKIHSMPLTPAQKDAVAKAMGWGDRTIRKYKLW